MATDLAKGGPMNHSVQGDLKRGNRMGLALAEAEELDQWEERGGHLEEANEGKVRNGPEQARDCQEAAWD